MKRTQIVSQQQQQKQQKEQSESKSLTAEELLRPFSHNVFDATMEERIGEFDYDHIPGVDISDTEMSRMLNERVHRYKHESVRFLAKLKSLKQFDHNIILHVGGYFLEEPTNRAINYIYDAKPKTIILALLPNDINKRYLESWRVSRPEDIFKAYYNSPEHEIIECEIFQTPFPCFKQQHASLLNVFAKLKDACKITNKNQISTKLIDSAILDGPDGDLYKSVMPSENDKLFTAEVSDTILKLIDYCVNKELIFQFQNDAVVSMNKRKIFKVKRDGTLQPPDRIPTGCYHDSEALRLIEPDKRFYDQFFGVLYDLFQKITKKIDQESKDIPFMLNKYENYLYLTENIYEGKSFIRSHYYDPRLEKLECLTED